MVYGQGVSLTPAQPGSESVASTLLPGRSGQAHAQWHATGYDRKTDPVRVRLSSQIVFLTPSGKPFRLSIKDGCQKRLGTAGKAGLTLATAGVQSAPFSLIRDVYLIRQRAIVWAQQTLSSVSHKPYL